MREAAAEEQMQRLDPAKWITNQVLMRMQDVIGDAAVQRTLRKLKSRGVEFEGVAEERFTEMVNEEILVITGKMVEVVVEVMAAIATGAMNNAAYVEIRHKNLRKAVNKSMKELFDGKQAKVHRLQS